ncbi:MAG: hypothetical protein HQ473_07630 [Cryomorphaceae bacterium]|nr:hypothetical protein [Cryomorphaceae bacterium]
MSEHTQPKTPAQSPTLPDEVEQAFEDANEAWDRARLRIGRNENPSLTIRAHITAQAAEIERLRGEVAEAPRRGQIVALEWVLRMDEKARGGLGNKGSWRKMAAAELSRLRSEPAPPVYGEDLED